MTQNKTPVQIKWGCGSFFLGAVFLCAFVLVFAFIQDNRQWSGAVTTNGVVTKVISDTEPGYRRSSGRTTVRETIDYRYVVKGQTFTNRETLPYDTAFNAGQTVSVRYQPNTPWDARLVTGFYLPVVPPLILSLLAGLIGIAGLLLRADREHQEKRKQAQTAQQDATPHV